MKFFYSSSRSLATAFLSIDREWDAEARAIKYSNDADAGNSHVQFCVHTMRAPQHTHTNTLARRYEEKSVGEMRIAAKVKQLQKTSLSTVVLGWLPHTRRSHSSGTRTHTHTYVHRTWFVVVIDSLVHWHWHWHNPSFSVGKVLCIFAAPSKLYQNTLSYANEKVFLHNSVADGCVYVYASGERAQWDRALCRPRAKCRFAYALTSLSLWIVDLFRFYFLFFWFTLPAHLLRCVCVKVSHGVAAIRCFPFACIRDSYILPHQTESSASFQGESWNGEKVPLNYFPRNDSLSIDATFVHTRVQAHTQVLDSMVVTMSPQNLNMDTRERTVAAFKRYEKIKWDALVKLKMKIEMGIHIILKSSQ